MKRVCLIFTSCIDGGIAQLAVKLSQALTNHSIDVALMVPEEFSYDLENEDQRVRLVKYVKVKMIYGHSAKLWKIVNLIMEVNPEIVIYLDNAIPSLQIANLIGSKIRQAVVVHDVTPHPEYFNLIRYFNLCYCSLLFRMSLKLFEFIICLSQNSAGIFCNHYPRYSKKIIIIPLGAHLIYQGNDSENFRNENTYYLFFGRIDRYKGLETLLQAYSTDQDNKLPALIIAGKGTLSKIEKRLLERLKNNVTHINEYIEEEKMVNLFVNARAIILPYIETSQSGVLAIAFQLGKPVIASDLPGFKEFVKHRETGLLFKVKDSDALYQCIREMSSLDKDYNLMCRNAIDYYNRNLDWDKNVKVLIEAINLKRNK